MDDLRRRLRRLGVTTGRDFTPRPAERGPDIDALVEGEDVEAGGAMCFRVVRRHPADTQHGAHPLGRWLDLDPGLLARLGDDGGLARRDPRRFVFLDTETTGLGGGAFAFLVGAGWFTDDGDFEIQQYFLRDPVHEPALLALLDERLPADAALVTFNGRSFDVPLLASRYVLARTRSHVDALPNLDLLHPARRLWRRRLASCALGALEVDVLGVERTHADVPGSLIPHLYGQYLRTHNARDMVRVLYHNEVDLLSMVSLAVTLGHAFEQPRAPGLPVADRLSLARWYASRGLWMEAEAAYRAAAEEASVAGVRADALTGLALLLKRQDRRAEALPYWEYLADLKLDVRGHEEIAKYYEWHAVDLARALEWTEAGIALAESWRPGWRRTEALREFNHRRDRLLRKLAGDS